MKKTIFILALLILISSALSYSMLTMDHDWGDDWASYVMQSISVLRGSERDFFVHNAFTIENSTRLIGPVAYPWGFPALLAPFYAACGGLNILCLKTINLVFFVLFLLALYFFLERRLAKVDVFLLLSVFAFSPVLLSFQNDILSDIVFLAASTFALVFIEVAFVFPGDFIGAARKNALAGAILFFAFFVRTNGVLLIGTLFLVQLILFWQRRSFFKLDRKRDIPLAAIPYAVFGVLTLVLLFIFPSGEASHITHYELLTANRILENAKYYFVMPVGFFEGVPFPEVFYGFLLPFAIGGIIATWRRDFHVILYSLLSVLVFTTWPERQGIRFFFPLLPFIVYFVFSGTQTLGNTLTGFYRPVFLWSMRGLWLFVALTFFIHSFHLASANLANRRQPDGGAFDPIGVEMLDFVRANTATDSVVIFYKPRAMHLLTGRDSIMVDDCNALDRGDYVVIRKKRGAVDQVLPDSITTCNPAVAVTQLFDNKKYIVYKIQQK